MSDKPKKVYLTFPEQQRLHALLLSWVGTDKLEHKKMDDIVAAVNDELDIDKTISGTHIKTLKGACDDLDWEPIKGRQASKHWKELLVIEVNKMLQHQAVCHSDDVEWITKELRIIKDRLSKIEPSCFTTPLPPSNFQARK
jgi:hypothetical protein